MGRIDADVAVVSSGLVGRHRQDRPTRTGPRLEQERGLALPLADGDLMELAALAMAAGALRRSRAHVAIAVTGIAGPGSATAGKPVGTVWIAWGLRRRSRIEVYAARFRFRGGRDAVRRRSVAAALEGLPAS